MEIISARTAAATSDKLQITQNMLPVVVMATKLSSGEEITIDFSDDGGSSWETLSIGGADQKLSLTNKQIGIFTPNLLRFTKGTTLNQVRVSAIIREYLNGEAQ